MNEFWLIAGMMAVTFGIRYPVLALLSKAAMPQTVFDALKYVPAAVLTAIIIPPMLLPDGKLDLSINNAPLFAGIASILIAWKSKNLLLTIVLGMLSLWGWRWLVGLI